MGYTAHELARVSGVSVRTLHYYEEQGLLHPQRRDNGYRDYNTTDVQRLQQILLYRRASMPLAAIQGILDQPPAVQAQALREQLDHLRAQYSQLAALITSVEQLIHETEHSAPLQERTSMSSHDAQRFEALKQQAIHENESTYGAEARQHYGDDAVNAVNQEVEAMSQDQWAQAQQQAKRIGELIARLATAPNPAEAVRLETGRELFELHRAWLMNYWTDAMYTPSAHCDLAQGYVDDPRFRAYYDAYAPNGAIVLRDAIHAWAHSEA